MLFRKQIKLKMDATQKIIEALETMKQGDLIRGEKFSAIAYAKAIKSIKALGKPIRSVDDVKSLAGIGKKIQDKVNAKKVKGKPVQTEKDW